MTKTPFRPPTLDALAAALAPHTDAERYAREDDPAGVWIASDRPVRRLGLRLAPGTGPSDWLPRDIDALLVHRPFSLWPARLPGGVGVLAVHRALDDRFATGYNPALAAEIGLTLDPEPLLRDGRPVGMVGALDDAEARVVAAFGGFEAVEGAPAEGEASARVAVVGAMTEALVLDAAARGVGVYVTGQMRQPAMQAVRQTGLRVVAVGQDRSERWGLRHLGRLLAAAFPGLAVVDLDAPLSAHDDDRP